MNTIHHLLRTSLAGAALLLAAGLMAQEAQPGLIGKNLAGFDLTYQDFSGARVGDGYGGVISVNLPISTGFDAGFSFGSDHISGSNFSMRNQALAGTALAYNPLEYGKAYLFGTVGLQMDKATALGRKTDYDATFWGIGTGVEVVAGPSTAVNLGLAYRDAFDDSLTFNKTMTYSIAVNHWVAEKVSLVASLAYHQIKSAPNATMGTLGVRVLF